MRRAANIVALVYLLGGIGVWISFMNTNPDGLANIGLMAYVLPVTLAGLLIGKLIGAEEFVLLPNFFGYWTDHALYFFPSMLLTAWLLQRVGRALGLRLRAKASATAGRPPTPPAGK